ncbi:hypothetical protein C8J56DRAFT_891362 [Mycena floridula]|nr:hypothetical protein C8J56DRAFT_891362 [Mycena floridula]
MPQSFISFLPVKNLYEATTNAVNSNEAINTRAIVESLGRTRALDLAILCGLFAFHISAKRSTDSLFALAAILLVRSIAVLYDGLDYARDLIISANFPPNFMSHYVTNVELRLFIVIRKQAELNSANDYAQKMPFVIPEM